MPDFLCVFIQYCLPQHMFSRFVGILANCRWVWFKTWAIKRLIRKHHVDLSEALSENLADYPTFNHFFTRRLKPHLRPIAVGDQVAVSPADGIVSQAGEIQDGFIFQAKKFNYTVQSLLGNSAMASKFLGGRFATFYLAPRNYHRVHMPLTGTLRETIYIPGRLFSVDQLTTASVPNLFARNERLVCLFDTVLGPMAVVLVGAMCVGQMRAVWAQNFHPRKICHKTEWSGVTLQKGEELGYFLMGSTVIVLFANTAIEWQKTICPKAPIKMGEIIAEVIKS